MTRASLSQTRDESPLFVWVLSGDYGARAFRIPAQADLLVRSVELSAFQQEEMLPIVFATGVHVADRLASSWLGHEGMTARHGDFHVDLVEVVAEREVDELEAPPIRIDVLCVYQVDLDSARVSEPRF